MAKVLIYSPNLIGKAMAGSAIRSWEFAKSLALEHQVVLISPAKVEIQAKEFTVVSLQECKKHFRGADVLITQRLTLPLAAMATKVKVIIDAYDPSPLELLEQFKSLEGCHQKVLSEISTLLFSFKMASGIICASEKQKELWLGFLLAQKLITPSLYDQNSSLSHFIKVIPFGLSATPPQKTGPGFREKYGLSPNDKIILWGGGIWNWFDPLSLIEALKLIKRTDIKLIFMGVKPPDPQLQTTSMASAAIQLAQNLGLLNQSVFFNQEWIPYEERENFLLEANLGASIHFDHLETRFSFRTRILDYLWAGLPILTTQGDSFASLVHDYQLGLVVPYRDPQAIATAILALIDRSHLKQHAVAQQFYWPSVVAPLNEMIKQCNHLPLGRRSALLEFMFNKLREKGIKSCCFKFLSLFRRENV